MTMARPDPVVGHEGGLSLARIAETTPPGCFVEVGVYRGGSAVYLADIAEQQGRELYLYDTFSGIPFQDEIDAHPVGDFGDTSLEAVREAVPSAKIVAGLFPDSIVEMPPVAFAHIDCDQYRSVKASIETLGPMMVKGGVMVLDDPFCLAGATKALEDSGYTYTLTDNNKARIQF